MRVITNSFSPCLFSVYALINSAFLLIVIPGTASADFIKPVVTANSELSFATYMYDSVLSPSNVDLITEKWECKIAQASFDLIGVDNDIKISVRHKIAPHSGEVAPGSLNTLLILNVDRRDELDPHKFYLGVPVIGDHQNGSHRDLIRAKYEPIYSKNFLYSIFIRRASRLSIVLDHGENDKQPTPLVTPTSGSSIIIVRWWPVSLTCAAIAVIAIGVFVLQRKKRRN